MARTNTNPAWHGGARQECGSLGQNLPAEFNRTTTPRTQASPKPRSSGGGSLRHRCRNLRCRSKLPTPIENEHHAFCTRGCYESFYRNRCRVCERDLRKTGKRGDAARLYCRPPANCRREAEKWPEKYAGGLWACFPETKLRSAHSTGLKIGSEDDRAPAYALRDWRWTASPSNEPSIFDLQSVPLTGRAAAAVAFQEARGEDADWSLYDKDGLTIARIVLAHDGRYHLRTQMTWPRMSWPDHGEAKRRAMSMALAGIPLASIDPRLAARVKRDNETPHPMGPPLNLRLSRETATPSDWKPTGDGADTLDIPDFLRRCP